MTKLKEDSQELKDLDLEISKEKSKVYEGEEYKAYEKEIHRIYTEESTKESELRKLKKDILKKYSNVPWNYWSRGLNIKDIKPSVKVGIKNGLGVKYICLLKDDDIIRIVKRLVEEDMEKTNQKEIQADLQRLQKETEAISKDKDKLLVNLFALQDKREDILNKADKNKLAHTEQQKKNGKLIGEKLPEFMDKIRKEVTKSLIVDSLQEKK